MNPENSESQAESKPSWQEKITALADKAREFFGFRAPVEVETVNRPAGTIPTAQIRSRPKEPFNAASSPIDIVIYRPADEAGREQLDTILPFLIHHEIAHCLPRQPDHNVYPVYAVPEEEQQQLQRGTHLKTKTVLTGVDEVVTDVLTLRSLQRTDGTWDESSWESYHAALTIMAGPRRLATAKFRDLLRGVTEVEGLLNNEHVPEEQKVWLREWSQMARTELDTLPPADQDLQALAEDYLRRAYRDTWEIPLDIRKTPQPE